MSLIKRLPLQSEIIDFIKQYIDNNKLRSGDRLPSQAEFVE
jgi:DNA-binding FadR family transcriptional regulator